MNFRAGKREWNESRPSLGFRTILFFLVWFSLVTTFLLAHIYLRFTIRDLRIETVRLQRQGEKMRSVEKGLVWEIGRLNQGDRLHEYANRDLGLKDVDPATLERLTVPEALIADYSTGGKTSGYEEAKWMEEKYSKKLGRDVTSLLEINRELNAKEQTLDAVWKRLKEEKKTK